MREVCQTNVDTPDELLASILFAAACVKINWDEKHAILALELQNALRLTVGFFEYLLWTVKKMLSFLFNKFVIKTLN